VNAETSQKVRQEPEIHYEFGGPVVLYSQEHVEGDAYDCANDDTALLLKGANDQP
jgi:hypothetical protein